MTPLAKAIKLSGMTVGKVAEKAKVNYRILAMYAAGELDPPASVLKSVANALKVRAGDLL